MSISNSNSTPSHSYVPSNFGAPLPPSLKDKTFPVLTTTSSPVKGHSQGPTIGQIDSKVQQSAEQAKAAVAAVPQKQEASKKIKVKAKISSGSHPTEKKMTSAGKTLTDMKAQLETKKNEVANLRVQNQAFQRASLHPIIKAEGTEISLNALNEKVVAAEEGIKDAKGTIDKNLKSLQDLNTQIGQLENGNKLPNTRSLTATLRATVTKLNQTSKNSPKMALTSLIENRNKLVRENQEAERTLAENTKKLRDLEPAINTFAKNVDHVKGSASQLFNQTNHLSETVTQLGTQSPAPGSQRIASLIKDCQTFVKQCDDTISELDKQVETMTKEMHQLSTDIQTIEADLITSSIPKA